MARSAVSKCFEDFSKSKSSSELKVANEGKRHGEVWRLVNEVKGRKKNKIGQISGKSSEDRLQTWFMHFKNLLGNHPTVNDEDGDIPTIFTDIDIDDSMFTIAELKRVKSSLRQGKSAGPDGIPPEVFKHCELDDILLNICNTALMKGDKPEQWSLSHIIPVPKSGSPTKPDNCRGISLTCTSAKIYNRMILNRKRSAIDPKLIDYQNGFREKRSTVTQIIALRRIIEEVKKNNLPAVLTFIDFKKAFDSIHWGK